MCRSCSNSQPIGEKIEFALRAKLSVVGTSTAIFGLGIALIVLCRPRNRPVYARCFLSGISKKIF